MLSLALDSGTAREGVSDPVFKDPPDYGSVCVHYPVFQIELSYALALKRTVHMAQRPMHSLAVALRL
jgi:hypothetical protein